VRSEGSLGMLTQGFLGGFRVFATQNPGFSQFQFDGGAGFELDAFVHSCGQSKEP
jgi:hypothetical protein